MSLAIDALLGAVLGAGFFALASRAGRGRDAWLGAGLLVAALVYPALGLPIHALDSMPVELFGVALFGALALGGALLSPWLLALGWALHAFWDLLLPWIADTGYVPPWYAAACLGFDLVVAGAVLARRRAGTEAVAAAGAR